ncbi:MAG: hypothetical protein H7Y01_04695 [Ferruginibacter sp.]|nr:hypothetical protein [Chitinophagaceae bacterium]
MLKTGNRLGWETLYDKYAAILYGSILRRTVNKKMAAKILTECFLSLPGTELLTQINKPLLVFLLHHTHTCCLEYLKASGVTIAAEKMNTTEYPLISLFLFTPHSALKIAQQTGVTERELRVKVHAEGNKLSSGTGWVKNEPAWQ